MGPFKVKPRHLADLNIARENNTTCVGARRLIRSGQQVDKDNESIKTRALDQVSKDNESILHESLKVLPFPLSLSRLFTINKSHDM